MKHRLKVRSSFRERASHLTSKLSLADAPREPIDIAFPDISEVADANWTVYTNEDIKNSIEDIGKRIDSMQSDITIYTDGSCTGGVRDGGAAAVVTDGPFISPNCIDIVEKKGNTHTCSYEEERRAMLLGLDWLQEHAGYKHVKFCTDSLSLLQAMESRHPDTAEIRSKIRRVCEHADLLFVPGHRDIPGNELADVHAKRAALMPGRRNDSVPIRTARTVIRKEIDDQPTKHRLASKFYASVKQDRDDAQSKTRKKAVLLAQIRSGHHKEFAYYDNFIDPTKSDVCRSCDSGEVDDTEHWFTRCEQTAAARQRIFGLVDIDMVELAISPAKTIELAEKTLDRAAMQG